MSTSCLRIMALAWHETEQVMNAATDLCNHMPAIVYSCPISPSRSCFPRVWVTRRQYAQGSNSFKLENHPSRVEQRHAWKAQESFFRYPGRSCDFRASSSLKSVKPQESSIVNQADRWGQSHHGVYSVCIPYRSSFRDRMYASISDKTWMSDGDGCGLCGLTQKYGRTVTRLVACRPCMRTYMEGSRGTIRPLSIPVPTASHVLPCSDEESRVASGRDWEKKKEGGSCSTQSGHGFPLPYGTDLISRRRFGDTSPQTTGVATSPQHTKCIVTSTKVIDRLLVLHCSCQSPTWGPTAAPITIAITITITTHQ